MKTRGAALQGTLAAIGLVAAYTTWQREPERAAGEVVVLDVNKNDLAKIRYEDGAKWVEVESRPDPEGSAVWLRVSANEKTKTPERELRGNEGANKLYEKFAPLRAVRALGTLAADKMKELGLDAPKKRIEVTARGTKHLFLIGNSAFNVSDPYVMDDHDKRVYVLGGTVLNDLDAASTRLVDRTLHGFKDADFDALSVSANGKTRELVRIGADNPLTSKLASKKTPTKPEEMLKNWHDKIWRLYVTDVLGKGEEPASGKPELAARVSYLFHGKEVGWVELGRVSAAPSPANTSAPPAPTKELYARTEHTAGWVKVPANVEDLIKEAEKIAAAE